MRQILIWSCAAFFEGAFVQGEDSTSSQAYSSAAEKKVPSPAQILFFLIFQELFFLLSSSFFKSRFSCFDTVACLSSIFDAISDKAFYLQWHFLSPSITFPGNSQNTWVQTVMSCLYSLENSNSGRKLRIQKLLLLSLFDSSVPTAIPCYSVWTTSLVCSYHVLDSSKDES